MTFTLIDKQDRGKLYEGRNVGIGFAFCKRGGDVITTVMPISCCKDYLGDQVYSERTGKSYSAYGFNSSKQGIFWNSWAYVVMGILPYSRTATLKSDHKELEESLMNPERGLKPFLSHFEVLLGINPTTFSQIAPNRLLGVLDAKWTEATYLISLWSLLVRVGLKFKEGDPMGFLKKVNDDDAYTVKAVIPKIERLMTKDFPVQDFTKACNWHDMGIQNFPFTPIKT